MEDYITLAHIAELREWLLEEGLVGEKLRGGGSGDDEPLLDIPKIPVKHVKEGTKNITLSVVRCVGAYPKELLERVVLSGTLETLGTIVDGSYVFYTPEDQDRYESIRKVGDHRGQVPSVDDNGDIIIVDGETVKEATTHSYMQGVFA